jgi:lincosamide and streptogramin A transport system ATP-binding/permease protein
MANFERQQAFELAQNERLQKHISRLQQAAKRSAVWSNRVEASKKGAADKGYVGHKAAKMMKRSKHIEERQQQAVK